MIITDYSIYRQYKIMQEPVTIERIPLYNQVRDESGSIIGYQQMSSEEIDREILLYSEEDGHISLSDFKRKYILSLT